MKIEKSSILTVIVLGVKKRVVEMVSPSIPG